MLLTDKLIKQKREIYLNFKSWSLLKKQGREGERDGERGECRGDWEQILKTEKNDPMTVG